MASFTVPPDKVYEGGFQTWHKHAFSTGVVSVHVHHNCIASSYGCLVYIQYIAEKKWQLLFSSCNGVMDTLHTLIKCLVEITFKGN